MGPPEAQDKPGSTGPPSRTPSIGSAVAGRKSISRPGSHVSGDERSRPGTGTLDERRAGSAGSEDAGGNIDRGEGGGSVHSGIITEIDLADDTGYDTDIELPETKETYDVSLEMIYCDACKQCGVVPASYFLRHMRDEELIMRHHGLGPKGARAIAIALVSNTNILKLDLSDNYLAEEGCKAIAEMLTENYYITDLNLSENKIGHIGAQAVADMLMNNPTLTHLTISAAALDESDAEKLAEAILVNNKLEHLDLSRNYFGASSADAIGHAIEENSSIRHLNLSWNNFRFKAAVSVAHGIQNNVSVKHCNLSWNGLSIEGAKALGDALRENRTLEELDITNNRINTEGAVLFAKGLFENEALKVLKMGQNPMQSAGCYGILVAIKNNTNIPITNIEFTDVSVNKDFEELLKEVIEVHPDVKVRHGGSEEGRKQPSKTKPLGRLVAFMERNNIQPVDMFLSMDTDGTMTVSREEFITGFAAAGMVFKDDEVTGLFAELDKDNSGQIHYSELLTGVNKTEADDERKKIVIESVLEMARSPENLPTD